MVAKILFPFWIGRGEGAEACELFHLDIFLIAEEQCLLPAGCTGQGTGQELPPSPGVG